MIWLRAIRRPKTLARQRYTSALDVVNAAAPPNCFQANNDPNPVRLRLQRLDPNRMGCQPG